MIQAIYYIPILTFLIISISMYLLEKDSTKKKTTRLILVRGLLPAVTLALVSFVVIKYKASSLFSPEKMMQCDYFETKE